MALMHSALDHNGHGMDERLLNLFYTAKHKPHMEYAMYATDRERQYKERVGLKQFAMQHSEMLQPSIQAEEALREWCDKYGEENSFMVTIEWRQYNLRNAVTMLKSTLAPARVGMWGIQSLVRKLADMVQSRDVNRFCLGQYGRNLYSIAMCRAFTVEKSREMTKRQKNQVHQMAQKTLSRYGIQDSYFPLVIADGMLSQL